ncbi:Ankyrin repeat protein [uncultured virus]|nr:Ankyrin repeat protein [uncultured virus]
MEDEHYRFICPLTRQIFCEPIVASDGYFYEKTAFLDYIIHKKKSYNTIKSPITNKPIADIFIDALGFKAIVSDFIEKNPKFEHIKYLPPKNITFETFIEILINGKYSELLTFKNFDLKYNITVEETLLEYIFLNISDKDILSYIFCNMNTQQLYVESELLDKLYYFFLKVDDLDKIILLNKIIGKYITYSGALKLYDVFKFGSQRVMEYYFTIIDKNDQYYNYYPLMIILRHQSIENILLILENNSFDLDIFDSQGNSPIHIACYFQNLEIIKLLTNTGHIESLLINSYNNEYLTPLHIACQYQDLETIKYLISLGANLNVKSKYGETPLHIACKYQDYETLEYLVNIYKDELNYQDNYGITPLHNICQYQALNEILLFINNGSSLTIKSKKLWTPFHVICKYQPSSVIKYFIDKKFVIENNVTINGWDIPKLLTKYHNSQLFLDFIDNYFDDYSIDDKIFNYIFDKYPSHMDCFLDKIQTKNKKKKDKKINKIKHIKNKNKKDKIIISKK